VGVSGDAEGVAVAVTGTGVGSAISIDKRGILVPASLLVMRSAVDANETSAKLTHPLDCTRDVTSRETHESAAIAADVSVGSPATVGALAYVSVASFQVESATPYTAIPVLNDVSACTRSIARVTTPVTSS